MARTHQRASAKTAQNHAAYGAAARSSRVTADVVYRLGRVPQPTDVKTTVGTMPRRQRGRGRPSSGQRGGAFELDDILSDDLRKVAKASGIAVSGKKKAEQIRLLREAGVTTYDGARSALGRTPAVTKGSREREAGGAAGPERTSTAELNRARQSLKQNLTQELDEAATANAPEPEARAAQADTTAVRAEVPAAAEVGSEPVPAARTASLRDKAPPVPTRTASLREKAPPIPTRSTTPPRKGTVRSGRNPVDLRTPDYRTPPPETDSSGDSFGSAAAASAPPTTPAALGDVAPTVSDPEALAALDRVATSTLYANKLLATMSADTSAQLRRLNDETQKLVLNDPRMDASEVTTVVERIQDNPDVARLVQAGLVRPEQLKDEAYVLSLKSALANRREDGRPGSMRGRIRSSAAPVFERSVPSRQTNGLKYYKRAAHVRPSIFAV